MSAMVNPLGVSYEERGSVSSDEHEGQRHTGRGLRDIAHLFLSDHDSTVHTQPAKVRGECTVGLDWHQRQMSKINSVGRLLERLDQLVTPHVDTIARGVPFALEGAGEGEAQRHLVHVRHAAEELQSIWKGLRDIRKRPAAMEESTDLAAVVQQALRLFPALSGQSGVRLDVRSSGETVRVRGSSEAIETAVFHVVRNAVEAMHGSGGVLTLTIDDSGLDEVELHISDNGPGIPQEMLEHVAEPLVTTKAERGHVGLGLTIALSLIDIAGGRAIMESTHGKGTTVKLAFPVCDTAP